MSCRRIVNSSTKWASGSSKRGELEADAFVNSMLVADANVEGTAVTSQTQGNTESRGFVPFLLFKVFLHDTPRSGHLASAATRRRVCERAEACVLAQASRALVSLSFDVFVCASYIKTSSYREEGSV